MHGIKKKVNVHNATLIDNHWRIKTRLANIVSQCTVKLKDIGQPIFNNQISYGLQSKKDSPIDYSKSLRKGDETDVKQKICTNSKEMLS